MECKQCKGPIPEMSNDWGPLIEGDKPGSLIVTTRYTCQWCNTKLIRITKSIEIADGQRRMEGCELELYIDEQHLGQHLLHVKKLWRDAKADVAQQAS